MNELYNEISTWICFIVSRRTRQRQRHFRGKLIKIKIAFLFSKNLDCYNFQYKQTFISSDSDKSLHKSKPLNLIYIERIAMISMQMIVI